MPEPTPNFMRLDQKVTEFARHLEGDDNSYIILSGKYGIGKTFFLDNFFNTERKDDYHAVFISPLKYAINSSENIFELLKLDIAMQLYDGDHWQEQDKVQDFEVNKASGYLGKRTLRFFKHFLKAASKVHPLMGVVSAAADGVNALMEDYENFGKDHDNKLSLTNPDVQLSMYLAQKLAEKGHFGEMDIVTESIMEVLKRTREADGKEWVLIIDDFDRIDPEHIFRILNVLSAHHTAAGGFKFGFDKVIIVCDYGQLERLYVHKYGEGGNFKGYIDKFHSKEVFNFKHSDSIREYFRTNHALGLDEGTTALVLTLIEYLFETERITMRNIRRLDGYAGVPEDLVIKRLMVHGQEQDITAKMVPAINLFPLLARVMGDSQGLWKVLEDLNGPQRNTMDRIFSPPNMVFLKPLSLFLAVLKSENKLVFTGVNWSNTGQFRTKILVKDREKIFGKPKHWVAEIGQFYVWAEVESSNGYNWSNAIHPTLMTIRNLMESSGLMGQIMPGART